jgi:hypothetical protein
MRLAQQWQKLGLIFEPNTITISGDVYSHSQSPQVLQFDEFIRIFFSVRTVDSLGKILSHITFADFNENFELMRTPKELVIELGTIGCFDEHGIFPLHVHRRNDGRIFGYIGGWNRRVSVPLDGAIGISESFDNGKTFHRMGNGPILSASVNEPYMIGDPFVLETDTEFSMYYIFGTKWTLTKDLIPERTYKIGKAISSDGLNWVKEDEGRQLIPNLLGETESQAMPTVFFYDGWYHMFFCFRSSFDFRGFGEGIPYSLGYAISSNGKIWERVDTPLSLQNSKSGWDSQMMCYPHVFKRKGVHYLLYNGNEFGKFGFGIAKLLD